MDDLRPRLEEALKDTYVFERELGGGGMSRTYLVRERALDRRVVVKVLAPELLAGISVERFRREVLLAAKLQHPHVVPVLTAGDTDGLPWFTMPYVDGDSLRQRLGQGPMGISEAVGILRDVARALAYAHAQGIVHRDIKPDNVLLSAGSATVTDFGIAKAISAARTGVAGAANNTMLTVAGTSIGTPSYMSPEQAAGDPATDHRADLYSFGAMAYELIAGRPPFYNLTPAKLLAAQMGETPKDIRTLRADCPDALAELIMRCLAKDADDRPQQAGDLVRVLDNITSSGAAAAAPTILSGGRINFGKALALWAGATALVALTAWAATDVIGLPDWVFPGSLGVMFAGLPVIVITWYVQRAVHRAYINTPQFTPGGTSSAHGTMATLAIKASPHLSWRRTWLGGGIAVGSFTALVLAFMVMRALGVGPFGSLRGKGTFGDKETLVVADFRSPASDSTLGGTVAEALRTDLGQSTSLRVLTRANVREILGMMQRSKESVVQFDLAREIATREGAKAVLDGEVVRLGKGYVVSARLVNALDGTELVTFRETASGEDDLIGALGKLSRAVRERTGESLKNLQRSSALERVSTPSLSALRKYVDAMTAADELGDAGRALSLLQEAVALDSGFAMAWRRMATLYATEGGERVRELAALEAAYRHRARLTDMERLLTEGLYYSNGPRQDLDKAIAAYEAASVLDSLNTAALNNGAIQYRRKRDFQRAEAMYKRVVAVPRPFGGSFTNLMQVQVENGHISGLDSTRNLFRKRFPNHADLWEADWYVAFHTGQVAQADSISHAAFAGARTVRQARNAARGAGDIALWRGQPKEALRWSALGNEAEQKGRASARLEQQFGLDSAVFLAGAMERAAEARAVIARTLARVPMTKLEPVERPWVYLLILAAKVHDPALARQAQQGWERDQSAFSRDAAGSRARNAAYVAMAEQKAAEAVPLFEEADKHITMGRRDAMIAIAQAHDLAGHADSAITWFEKFASTRTAIIDLDADYLAGTYKRLGELYDAKGDKAKAIASFEKFVEMWKDAEPELQPKVAEVREKLKRLRGLRG